MRAYITIITLAVLFSMSAVFPSEQIVDANFSGYMVENIDGKHIVLDAYITPSVETSCFTFKITWDKNIFSLEHRTVSCTSTDIKEFDDGIVFYFSEGAQKTELTLKIENLNFENSPISLDIYALPSAKDNHTSKMPKISVLHKEISVSNGNENNIATFPKSVVLHQNSPNPFNSSTTLEYGVPEKSDVRLSIYDVTGKEICNLISGERNAGFYRIIWDGKDSKKNPVPSGIYFAKIKVGNDVRTIKMQLLK